MKGYQDKIKELANNCCLAMCYIWSFEPDVSFAKMIKYLGVALDKGYISESGFVNDADKLIFMVSGKTTKVFYSTQNNGKMCIANFVNGKNNHWCVVDANDNVLYNPLEYSNCVENGHIEEYRIW